MAAGLALLRRRSSAVSSLLSFVQQSRLPSFCHSSSTLPSVSDGSETDGSKGRWMTLPPFAPYADAASIGKEVARGNLAPKKSETTTVLKWVRRCCPSLPVSLVQKLFRLRRVRRQVVNSVGACVETEVQQRPFRRVSAKDEVCQGDVILLPISAQECLPDKKNYCCSNDEINYIRSLELYKDPAIIVLNKPHGMPVQGGIGIKWSIDALAATSLKYDYEESPRLVHRLDKDSSGILVLGRTQISASILHSIFREKTFGASTDVGKAQRILQRKYWAIVIGTPRNSRGIISSPLSKVVLENGKTERMTISNHSKFPESQVAVTEYKVIRSFDEGYSWLELSPLTGRKHQLRVHCAEALGTPILGDYKYGWNAHKRWKPFCPNITTRVEKFVANNLPFGLDSDGGSVSDKRPHLHLHCNQMIIPNIAAVVQHLSNSDPDLSKSGSLDFVAPLPHHMQKSVDILP